MADMLYPFFKYLHVTCVSLSLIGFCLRFGLFLAPAGRRWWEGQPRILRALPHLNDTLLLMAALVLSAMLGQYPFLDGWLTAKVFGLIGYILLGAVALNAGQTTRLRLLAGTAALLCYGWIVSVALTKQPSVWLANPA